MEQNYVIVTPCIVNKDYAYILASDISNDIKKLILINARYVNKILCKFI